MAGQIDIGKRAHEEVLRVFYTQVEAKRLLGIKSGRLLYDWMNGASPGSKYLQRLHYAGADVIYILTGERTKK